MKNFFLLTVFSFIFCCNGSAEITYELSGGRFGDSLMSYLHAKWISFVYDIPLAYRSFQYSDQLVLHSCEKHLGLSQPTKRVTLTKYNLAIDKNRDCLYVVPYFAEVLSEHKFPGACHWIYFPVNWNNELFYSQICSLIKPIDSNLLNFTLPLDKITVALHVRKGGGYDRPLLSDTQRPDHVYSYYSDYHSMLKFPPEFFFIEQLKRVSNYFDHKPIYAYVFTDDANPAALVERFKKQLNEYPNIELDYRKEGNRHDSHVVEDFFALTKFDCLIRPQSNFSLVAAKIANYKLEIYPTECHWEERKPCIDKVEMLTERHFNMLK